MGSSSTPPIACTAHPWHGVPTRSTHKHALNAFVEIVPTDTVKYELDKASGLLRIDRPQRFSSMCPMLYGFVPRTYSAEAVAKRCGIRTGITDLSGDGDPMDICILTEKTFAHGNFLCSVYPIGGLRIVDTEQVDDKIIAVLEADLAFGQIRELGACPQGLIERLKHYFLTYKQEPGKSHPPVHIAEVYDSEEALHMIGCGEQDYATHFGVVYPGL